MKIRSLIPALAIASSLLVADAALAGLTLDPNPTTFTNGLATGQIELVAVDTGVPMDGTVLEGAVGGGDQTFVFKITMLMGSIRRFGVGAWQGEVGTGTPMTSNGAGAFTGDAGATVSMFSFLSGSSERIFEFNGSAGVTAPEMTQRFFVSLDPATLSGGDEFSFMITPGAGLGSTFSIEVPLIPGPGSLAAIGLGAFALVTTRRRRRRE